MHGLHEIIAPIKMDGKAKIFSVQYEVLKPCAVEICLVDLNPARPGVCFGCKEESFTGPAKRRVDLKLPLVKGKYFSIDNQDLYPEYVGFAFRINVPGAKLSDYVKFKHLLVKNFRMKPAGFTKKEAEFTQFITEFALQAPYLAAGKMYHSDRNSFELEYMETIADNPVTPMRIAQDMNYIQASAYLLRGKPVPRIIGIGDHEYSHNNENTDANNEEQADINGAKLFAMQQWNDWEYMYAFTKTFQNAGETPANIKRIHNLRNFYHRSNFLRH